MAIATTLRGFNDLGRSVTPIFLSMGNFHYRFSMFCGCKNEENLSSRSLNFFQYALWNSVYLAFSVSNTSLRVKVCENYGNI